MDYNPNAWEDLGDSFTNNYELGLLDYRQNIIDTILKYEYECNNLLDIGCADGWFVDQLKQRGYPLFCMGIDITPNLIERARKRVPSVIFKIGDAMDIEIKDSLFDFVLCAGILMHLPYYRQAIQEACRVSSKYVMFSTYGTYKRNYSLHDTKNGFLNYFYTISSILINVPPEFNLIEFKSFKRKAGDHIFQFLYRKNNESD